jgi:hypothetical protein
VRIGAVLSNDAIRPAAADGPNRAAGPAVSPPNGPLRTGRVAVSADGLTTGAARAEKVRVRSREITGVVVAANAKEAGLAVVTWFFPRDAPAVPDP